MRDDADNLRGNLDRGDQHGRLGSLSVVVDGNNESVCDCSNQKMKEIVAAEANQTRTFAISNMGVTASAREVASCIRRTIARLQRLVRTA